MGWLKAGVLTTIICAIVMVAAMVLLSIAQKGFELRSVVTMIGLGLPLGLLAAAPICLVVLPAADAILDRRGLPLFRDLTIVGAIAGALVPLVVMFGFGIKPPGMIGTITALLILAGLVGGAAAGLFYAEIVERLEKR